VKNNTDLLLGLFASSHDLLTNVITTFLTFTPEDDYTLNTKTIFTTILQDDLSIKKFNLTLSSSCIETNTALYHTAHLSINSIIMTNKDIFFYLYNSLFLAFATTLPDQKVFFFPIPIPLSVRWVAGISSALLFLPAFFEISLLPGILAGLAGYLAFYLPPFLAGWIERLRSR
jgi:hypothetical protein